MANNCSLKFNETKVGTNLKAEVGNDDVLFNSLMSAVIDGSRPSGFNKEFETYYSNNYGSIPSTNDENKKVDLDAGSNDDFNYDDFSSRPEFPSLYSAIESLPMEQHSQFATLLASGDVSITCK